MYKLITVIRTRLIICYVVCCDGNISEVVHYRDIQ